METKSVEIDVEMEDELKFHVRSLALKYFGDDTQESISLVLELAFKMRLFFSNSVKKCQNEIGEPVSNWDFTESSEPNTDNVQAWLFRRK